MDLPPAVALPLAVVFAVGVFVLRTRLERKRRQRADREPQIPTVPRVIGAAVLGAVMLGVGIVILVTADDLSAGTGSGRLEWLPAWIQVLGLVAVGLYLGMLAMRNWRGVRERRARGADAAAFDPLARDADVVDGPRP